ncbi:MAG: hypothetical protein KKF22_16585 [Gammaproteobacteria bacterium]|nr:hypothetical protein [Gammaproteobacteria bacterium]
MAEIPEKPDKSVTEDHEQLNTVPVSPYAGIKRQISEEDLQSPAVQRILLGEVDKLERKVGYLEMFIDRYHISDKKAAILEEKLKSVRADEVLYGLCLTIGSAIIGLSSMVWSIGYGGIVIVIGSVLLLGGLISKVIKWRS